MPVSRNKTQLARGVFFIFAGFPVHAVRLLSETVEEIMESVSVTGLSSTHVDAGVWTLNAWGVYSGHTLFFVQTWNACVPTWMSLTMLAALP